MQYHHKAVQCNTYKSLRLIFGYPVIIHVYIGCIFSYKQVEREKTTSMEQCLQTIHKQKEREDLPFKEKKKKSAAYTNPQSAGMALTKDSFERIKWLITAAW